MSTHAIVPTQQMVPGTDFTREELDIIKSTVARDLSDAEFKMFLYMARARGLNPIKKQIYAIMRWDTQARKNIMTIQTSIDGLRLIAERTGNYSPGREPTYVERENGLYSATAYVMKRTADGTWHEVAATAFWDEYRQTTKDGSLTSFWKRMPHGQLGKCAEALALRKAFPDDTAGIYTFDEMAQADSGQDERPPQPVIQMPRRLSERMSDGDGPDSGLVLGSTPVDSDRVHAVGHPQCADAEVADDTLALLERSVAEVNAKAETYITEAQRKRLFAIAKGAGHKHEDFKSYLGKKYAIFSTSKITHDIYEELADRLRSSSPLV